MFRRRLAKLKLPQPHFNKHLPCHIPSAQATESGWGAFVGGTGATTVFFSLSTLLRIANKLKKHGLSALEHDHTTKKSSLVYIDKYLKEETLCHIDIVRVD